MLPRDNNKEKKVRYRAFLDAEYTCFMKEDTYFDRNHSNEVLSVGIVITDQKFHVKEKFYSVIRPKYNMVLTPYCKHLTGLTQNEIYEAPSYEEVFRKIEQLFIKYPVNSIYVWGNDRATLEDDLKKNHPFASKKIKKIISRVEDLTKKLTVQVYGKSISLSLSDMKYICGMRHETAHNALDDAYDLFKVTQCIYRNRVDEKRAERLYEYVEERNQYHRFRRFRQKYPMDLFEKKKIKNLQKVSEEYIKCLQDFYADESNAIAPDVKALCDDIRHIVGLDSRYCPKLYDE